MTGKAQEVALSEIVNLRTEKVVSHKNPNIPYIGLEHIAQGMPILLGTAPSTTTVVYKIGHLADNGDTS